MSNYPQTPSYGANSNPPYLPPTYPNQYLQPDDDRTNQGHMASNYDASMSAYTYNRNAPAFSAAAVASGVPPLPIYQGWNQDTIPLPPYTLPQNGGQYNGYGSSVQSQPYYPPPVQPSYQQPSHLHQNKLFEPDLSEGEFEDGVVAANTPTVGYGASQYRGNDGTGYVDTAQRAVYPRAQEFSPQQSYPTNNYNYPPRDHSQARRQQSDSYSPYASPSVPNNVERPSGAHHQSAYTPGQSQESLVAAPLQPYGWPQKSAKQSEAKPSTNGHNPPQNGEGLNQRAANALPPTPSLSMNGTGASRGKSVAESRKKAQGAIESLWHYNIGFQTYVDEGFKEDLIEHLFVDLNLPRNSLDSGSGTEHALNSQTNESRAAQFQNTRQQNLVAAIGNAASAGIIRASKTGPDAIAPLSVTTNGNLAIKATVPQTPTDQIKTPVASAPAKSVSMIEKDKALKSKMDALRKSREDRAQKAAAKSVPPSAIAAIVPVPDERSKVVAGEATTSKEDVSVQATNSLSKSPSVPKSDFKLAAEMTTSIAKEQTISMPATKVIPVQHQLPAIPGLFLASTATSLTPQVPIPSAIQSPFQGNQRKRPVAADFDEPVSDMTPFKRPFGQSRSDKPLVIDVSEEEIDSDDEDVAMDLESLADDIPAQPMRKHSDQFTSTVQTLSTTNSLAQQPKPWSPPSFSSAASTPPALQQASRSGFGRPEILQRKESEIEELKKKIAEAEAKKRKSKQTQGGARTPRTTETAATEGKSTPQSSGAGPTQIVPSSLVQQLVDFQEKNGADEQREQAELRAAEVAKASEMKRLAVKTKRIAAEQKRVRREKIASDIAALKAADEHELAEIERKKAEVEQMEATRRTTLEAKQRMEEEMQLLGQDEEDEHESQNGDLAQHEKPDTPIVEAPASNILDRPLSSSPVMEEPHKPLAPANEQDLIRISVASPATEPEKLTISGDKDTEGCAQSSGLSPMATSDQDTAVNGHSLARHVNRSSRPVSQDRMGESKAGLSNDQALEAALQEAVRIEAVSHVYTEEDTDMDISYATEPAQPVGDSPSSPAEEVPNSPEYSPELDRGMPDMPDRESDDYEPPEATPPVDAPPDAAPTANSPHPPDSPPFSPAPPADVSEPADDMMLDLDLVQIRGEKASEISSKMLPVSDGSQTELVETRAEQADRLQSYTPYESPLKHFHAYRFHPQFKQEIPGGLKSMTYSHRINPNKELCRFELAGGICNDPTCDLQHFREIGLPDDAVLTALGSPDEFQGEQRERFCVGLKEVLLKLRVNKVRDFNIIASEIIAHRSRFLDDNSKVLPLEGTSI